MTSRNGDEQNGNGNHRDRPTKAHGFSMTYTPKKQALLWEFLGRHIPVSWNALQKARGQLRKGYVWVELTAGCGYSPDLPSMSGSPKIACDLLAHFSAKCPFDFIKAAFFEEAPGNYRILSRELIDLLGKKGIEVVDRGGYLRVSHYRKGLYLPDFSIWMKDQNHVDALDEILRYSFLRSCEAYCGCFYLDSNGFGMDDEIAMYYLAKLTHSNPQVHYLDILLHLGGTQNKRVRGVRETARFGDWAPRPMGEYLDKFNKRNIYMSQPQANSQFTLFFLTNADLNRMGMRFDWLRSIRSDEGRMWLDRFDRTVAKREEEPDGPSLPGPSAEVDTILDYPASVARKVRVQRPIAGDEVERRAGHGDWSPG